MEPQAQELLKPQAQELVKPQAQELLKPQALLKNKRLVWKEVFFYLSLSLHDTFYFSNLNTI